MNTSGHSTSMTGSDRAAVASSSRCCPSHPDWPTLTQHLLREFSDLADGAVVRVVHAAKEAVALVDLSTPEQLGTAEAIARQELLILSGRAVDIARLDPERHLNRS